MTEAWIATCQSSESTLRAIFVGPFDEVTAALVSFGLLDKMGSITFEPINTEHPCADLLNRV